MNIFVYGTTAELIKLWPVVSRLGRDEYILVSTGQQPHDLAKLENVISLRPDFSLRGPTDPPLTRMTQVLIWSMQTSVKLFKVLGKGGFEPNKSMVIVHGDTITSTLAALIAYALKYKVAHIEAGLRSRNLLSPFPEEIDRILTSFVASVHFAPGAEATSNLTSRARKSEVIDTHRNTVVDAQSEMQKIKPKDLNLPEKFSLVCLHRSELLSNKNILNQTMRTLVEISQRVHVVMVVDPLTEANLRSQASYRTLENSRHVTVVRKLIYPEFQYLLQNCEFLITDSGGQQEESAQLGIPCIVHRRATERVEGIGENVVLSYWSQERLIGFSNDYRNYIRPRERIHSSPSDVIVARLRLKNHG